MSKSRKAIIVATIFVVIISIALCLPVTTKQCINFHCRELRIPLYLKLLDFFDRHCNYNLLVSRITGDTHNDEDKVLNIFEWTCAHIRKNPSDLPVVDDHVWNIIIRGYGIEDQVSDVFSTLCNYAGYHAFFRWCSLEKENELVLPFVKIKGIWYVFDASRGVYFRNKLGAIASLKDIKEGKAFICRIRHSDTVVEAPLCEDYARIIPGFIQEEFSRANIQSPLRRAIFGLKNACRRLTGAKQ